jgi:hypothetical protein
MVDHCVAIIATFPIHPHLSHPIHPKWYIITLSSSQLLIDFTFRTELHHRIAIAAYCYFSSVSHFAPNYIIASPSLVTANFHRFITSHRTTSSHCHCCSLLVFIGFTFRTELHHRHRCSPLTFIIFTFSTELHHHISLALHHRNAISAHCFVEIANFCCPQTSGLLPSFHPCSLFSRNCKLLTNGHYQS